MNWTSKLDSPLARIDERDFTMIVREGVTRGYVEVVIKQGMAEIRLEFQKWDASTFTNAFEHVANNVKETP